MTVYREVPRLASACANESGMLASRPKAIGSGELDRTQAGAALTLLERMIGR